MTYLRTLRAFVKDVSPVVLSVLAITMGATWGVRETWSNNYHSADAEIYDNAIQSKSLNTVSLPPDAAELIAKNWIAISEDFRRASIYMSLSTADQLLAILVFAISYEYSIGKDQDGRVGMIQNLLSLGSFVLGFVIVFLSMVAVAYKYQYWRLGSIFGYERFSWCIADQFPSSYLPMPPLIAPSQLQWSGFLAPLLQNPRIVSYLQSLPNYQDELALRTLAGVSISGDSCGPWPMALLITIGAVMIIGMLLYHEQNKRN